MYGLKRELQRGYTFEAIAGGMPATGVSQDVETGKLESTIHSLPIPGLSVLTMM